MVSFKDSFSKIILSFRSGRIRYEGFDIGSFFNIDPFFTSYSQGCGVYQLGVLLDNLKGFFVPQDCTPLDQLNKPGCCVRVRGFEEKQTVYCF